MVVGQYTNKDFLLHVSSMGGRNHSPHPQGSISYCVCVWVSVTGVHTDTRRYVKHKEMHIYKCTTKHATMHAAL